VLFIANSLLAN